MRLSGPLPPCAFPWELAEGRGVEERVVIFSEGAAVFGETGILCCSVEL